MNGLKVFRGNEEEEKQSYKLCKTKGKRTALIIVVIINNGIRTYY